MLVDSHSLALSAGPGSNERNQEKDETYSIHFLKLN